MIAPDPNHRGLKAKNSNSKDMHFVLLNNSFDDKLLKQLIDKIIVDKTGQIGIELRARKKFASYSAVLARGFFLIKPPAFWGISFHKPLAQRLKRQNCALYHNVIRALPFNKEERRLRSEKATRRESHPDQPSKGFFAASNRGYKSLAWQAHQMALSSF